MGSEATASSRLRSSHHGSPLCAQCPIQAWHTVVGAQAAAAEGGNGLEPWLCSSATPSKTPTLSRLVCHGVKGKLVTLPAGSPEGLGAAPGPGRQLLPPGNLSTIINLLLGAVLSRYTAIWLCGSGHLVSLLEAKQ